LPALEVGSIVDVAGVMLRTFGRTRFAAHDVTITGDGQAPTPLVVRISALGRKSAKDLDGTLLRLENVTVKDVDSSFGRFSLNEHIVVVDSLFALTPPPTKGQRLAHVDGVLRSRLGRWELLPRRAGDIVLADASSATR